MERDDKAERLHCLLLEIQEASSVSTGAGKVLCDVVGVERASEALTILLNLLADVKQQIRALQSTHSVDAYMTLIEPIEDWIGSLNLRDAINKQAKLDDRAVAALCTCSDQIQGVSPLGRVEADELARLRQDTDRLLADVLGDALIDPGLRRFLLKLLFAFIDAIDRYGLTGSAGLLDAITAAAGEFAIYRPVTSDEQGSSLFKRAIALCSGALVMMTTFQTAVALPANLRDSFERLAGHQVEQPALPPPRTPELPPAKATEPPVER